MIPFSTQYNILKFLCKINNNKGNATFMSAPSVKRTYKKNNIDIPEMRSLFIERGLCANISDFDDKLLILQDIGYVNKNHPTMPAPAGLKKMEDVLTVIARRMIDLDIDPMKNVVTLEQLTALKAEI